MPNITEWSVKRRVESLRLMDKQLSEMNVASRYTIWKSYGGLKATKDETFANWERIAKSDQLYSEAIFCYMICTLEKFTILNIVNAKE